MGKAGYVSSRFKGVYSDNGGKTWRTQLGSADGKSKIHPGTYETEEHAARAVDK
jgi:hypothetical protein